MPCSSNDSPSAAGGPSWMDAGPGGFLPHLSLSTTPSTAGSSFGMLANDRRRAGLARQTASSFPLSSIISSRSRLRPPDTRRHVNSGASPSDHRSVVSQPSQSILLESAPPVMQINAFERPAQNDTWVVHGRESISAVARWSPSLKLTTVTTGKGDDVDRAQGPSLSPSCVIPDPPVKTRYDATAEETTGTRETKRVCQLPDGPERISCPKQPEENRPSAEIACFFPVTRGEFASAGPYSHSVSCRVLPETPSALASAEEHTSVTGPPSGQGCESKFEKTDDQTDRFLEDDTVREPLFYTPLSSPSKDIHKPSKEKGTGGGEGDPSFASARGCGFGALERKVSEEGSPTSVDWRAMCSRKYTPKLGMLQRCCDDVEDRGEAEKLRRLRTPSLGDSSHRERDVKQEECPSATAVDPSMSWAVPPRFSIQRRSCQRPASWKRARRFGGTWRDVSTYTHPSSHARCRSLFPENGGNGSLSTHEANESCFSDGGQSMPFIFPSTLASQPTREGATASLVVQPGGARSTLIVAGDAGREAMSGVNHQEDQDPGEDEGARSEDTVSADNTLDYESPVFESPSCDADEPSVAGVFRDGDSFADAVARRDQMCRAGSSLDVSFRVQSDGGRHTGISACDSQYPAGQSLPDATSPGTDVRLSSPPAGKQDGPQASPTRTCPQSRPATEVGTPSSKTARHRTPDQKTSHESLRVGAALSGGRVIFSGVDEPSAGEAEQVSAAIVVRPGSGEDSTLRRSFGPGGWERFEEDSSEDSDVCSLQREKWREHARSRSGADVETQLPGRTRRSSLLGSFSSTALPGGPKCRKQDKGRDGDELRSESCAASFFKEWSEGHISDEGELDKEDRRVLKRRRFSVLSDSREAVGFEEAADNVKSDLEHTRHPPCLHTPRGRPGSAWDAHLPRRPNDPVFSGSPPVAGTVLEPPTPQTVGASFSSSSCAPLDGNKRVPSAPSQPEATSATSGPLLSAPTLSQSTLPRSLRKRKRQSIGNASRLLLLHFTPPADEAEIVNSLGTALTAEETQELRQREEEERKRQFLLAERQKEEERRKAVEEFMSQQKAGTELARHSAEGGCEVQKAGGDRAAFVFGTNLSGSDGSRSCAPSVGNTAIPITGGTAPLIATSVSSRELSDKTPAVQQPLGFAMPSTAVSSSAVVEQQAASNSGGPAGLSQRRPRLTIVRSSGGGRGGPGTAAPSSATSPPEQDAGVITSSPSTGAGNCVSSALAPSSVPSVQSALLLNGRTQATPVWGASGAVVGTEAKNAQSQTQQGEPLTQAPQRSAQSVPLSGSDGLVPGFGTEALTVARGGAPSVFTQGAFGGALRGGVEGVSHPGANPFAFQRGRGGRGAARGRAGRRR